MLRQADVNIEDSYPDVATLGVNNSGMGVSSTESRSAKTSMPLRFEYLNSRERLYGIMSVRGWTTIMANIVSMDWKPFLGAWVLVPLCKTHRHDCPITIVLSSQFLFLHAYGTNNINETV